MDRFSAKTFLEKPWNKKEKFVKNIADKIPKSESIGYAGFQQKRDLEKFLKHIIYSDEEKPEWEKLGENECKKEIKKAMKNCKKFSNNWIHIFVFPTTDTFIKTNMKGVCGWCVFDNTIIIAASKTKNWKKVLRASIYHEFTHAIRKDYRNDMSLLEQIVFDGIAERFSEKFEKNSYIPKKIEKKEALKIFDEIKTKLKSKNEKLLKDIFYGTGKYPMWAGYAIGYWLCEPYIKKHKWNETLEAKPEEILRAFRESS